jgi:hypothetical protein
LFIDFQVCVTYSVLGTCLPFVLNYFTIQTVVLLAAWAYKILVIFFKEKNIFTVRSGTPRYIILLIGSLIKRFLIEFFHRRLSKYSSHIWNHHIFFALWTLNVEISFFNLGVKICSEAFSVIRVCTFFKWKSFCFLSFFVQLIHFFDLFQSILSFFLVTIFLLSFQNC